MALKGPNKVRRDAARDPERGPGLQCFSCLEGVCFVERCLAKAEKGSYGTLDLCTRNTKLTECAMCVQEIEADPKRKGKFKPYHTIICCRDGHAGSVDAKSIDSFKSLYGDGAERLCVGLASI